MCIDNRVICDSDLLKMMAGIVVRGSEDVSVADVSCISAYTIQLW